MRARQPDPPSVRYIAYVIWGSMMLGALAMMVVATFVGPGIRENLWEPFPVAFPISAALTNMVLLPGSRLIPRVLKEEMAILRKNIVAAAISEVGALYAAVAWMLTGHRHALAGVIMGFAGLAICYPNDARWRMLGGLVQADLAPRGRSSGPGVDEP